MKADPDRAGGVVDAPSTDVNRRSGASLDGEPAPCPNCGVTGSGDGVLRPGQLWCRDENCAVVSFLGSEQC